MSDTKVQLRPGDLWQYSADVQLVPDGVPMPSAIAEANAAARAADEAQAIAHQEARDAQALMDDAPRADEEADRRAAEAGEEMPERTEPAKRAAFAIANREAQARFTIARQHMLDLYAVIAEHRAEWEKLLEPKLDESRARLFRAIDKLPALYFDHETTNAAYAAVAGYQGDGFPEPMFDEVRPSGDVELSYEATKDLVHNQMVPRTTEHLVAALRQIVHEAERQHRRGQW